MNIPRGQSLALTAAAAGLDEARLRVLLWERHGCTISELSDDGGQMWCKRCGIDFRHMSSSQIFDTFLSFKKGARELK